MTVPDKFICDGCGRICNGSDFGGRTDIARIGNGNVYGNQTLSLLYCKECWPNKQANIKGPTMKGVVSCQDSKEVE